MLRTWFLGLRDSRPSAALEMLDAAVLIEVSCFFATHAAAEAIDLKLFSEVLPFFSVFTALIDTIL